MKRSRHDVDKLLWPCVVALTLLLLAALMAWWSHDKRLAAQRQHEEAKAREQRAEQHLGQARVEEQELRAQTLLFQRLRQSGIVGPERRLEWVELLRDSQRRLHIPGLSYEFGTGQPLPPGGGNQIWFASPMRMQLRLAHEEDILKLITHLQYEAKAMVLIRWCSLAPLAGQVGGGDDLAHLSAECDLRWLTIDRP